MAAALERRIGGAELRILLVLGLHANADGVCWPGVETIAAKTGLATWNVRRALRRLEAAGIVKCQQRSNNGKTLSNLYVLASSTPITGVGDPITNNSPITDSTPITGVGDPITNVALQSPVIAEQPKEKTKDTAPPCAGARDDGGDDLVKTRPEVLKPKPLAVVVPATLAETPQTAFDALTPKEEAALVVSVGHRILEACETDPAKWAGNYSLVSMWLRSGFDPDLDIIPTCQRLTKALGHFPSTLKYFSNAIDESFQTRNATIQPSMRRSGNGGNSGRQQTTGRRHARRQDIASVLGLLPEEIWPTHGAITIEGVVND